MILNKRTLPDGGVLLFLPKSTGLRFRGNVITSYDQKILLTGEGMLYMQEIQTNYRVALLGIYHESNTFIETTTTLQDFINGHWLKGEMIRLEYQNAHHEIGGMLEVLDGNNIEAVPVMFAEATPGGKISNEAYEVLLRDMMLLLKQQLPVDACLVIPHGAGVTETYADMDGHWLSLVRETVGRNVPVIGTLDPHANVSESMLAATDALIAYKTNPHLDQRETGRKAAELLVQFLEKKIKPVQCLTQTPVAISIEQQGTAVQPCKQLYHLAGHISREARILSVSIILGFPYADVFEMGSSFIVVSDGSAADCITAGELLKTSLVENKQLFVGPKISISSQLPFIKTFDKPVLLLDMGDNVGAGSPGNSAFLLREIEAYAQFRSFICIFDPEAVERACAFKENEIFLLSFGNQDGTGSGNAYSTSVTLLRTCDGKFSEPNPRHGGQVNYDMGKIAIVMTGSMNVVMLISFRVPPFSLSQLTSFGIHPKDFDVVIAKGVNAPIAAYGPVCATIVQVDTPGVTQADMTRFSYRNRRRPLYPFEDF